MAPPDGTDRGRQTKAERRRARAGRRTPAGGAASAHTRATGDREGGAPSEDPIEERLERLEEAVANQSEQSKALLTGLTQGITVQQPRERAVATDEDPVEGMRRALKLRRDNVVPVDEPLVLISQAQRSGGTLLARLFDGHPQCHVHPHELHIGERRPYGWPELTLDEEPEAWFAKLSEDWVSEMFAWGRRQIPLKRPDDRSEPSYQPLILPPKFQRSVFLAEVARRGPLRSYREILDCYMTSLFNGWLDNQDLRSAEKRWVVAFSPRRAWGRGREKFFRVYPDGRLISILRDPLSWYASAQGRDPDADPDELLEHWKRSASEMIEAEARDGERFCLVRFDKLVLETAETMRRLADFLAIDFDPQMTAPTFNRYPVGANSSFGTSQTGVVTDPVKRRGELLPEDRQERVRAECEDLYQEALAVAERQASQAAAEGGPQPSALS